MFDAAMLLLPGVGEAGAVGEGMAVAGELGEASAVAGELGEASAVAGELGEASAVAGEVGEGAAAAGELGEGGATVAETAGGPRPPGTREPILPPEPSNPRVVPEPEPAPVEPVPEPAEPAPVRDTEPSVDPFRNTEPDPLRETDPMPEPNPRDLRQTEPDTLVEQARREAEMARNNRPRSTVPDPETRIRPYETEGPRDTIPSPPDPDGTRIARPSDARQLLETEPASAPSERVDLDEVMPDVEPNQDLQRNPAQEAALEREVAEASTRLNPIEGTIARADAATGGRLTTYGPKFAEHFLGTSPPGPVSVGRFLGEVANEEWARWMARRGGGGGGGS